MRVASSLQFLAGRVLTSLSALSPEPSAIHPQPYPKPEPID